LGMLSMPNTPFFGVSPAAVRESGVINKVARDGSLALRYGLT